MRIQKDMQAVTLMLGFIVGIRVQRDVTRRLPRDVLLRKVLSVAIIKIPGAFCPPGL